MRRGLLTLESAYKNWRKDSCQRGNPSVVFKRFISTAFFIKADGYLISNYHVVKDATKVRLLTSAGLIDAKVVQVDAANDLALLKANAEGRMKNEETFKPLPIAASRTVALGGTVASGVPPRRDELRGQEPGGTACCRPQFQGRRHGVPPKPGIGASDFGKTQSASHG
ncbi:MAG: serine protease [Verrucomicrobiia bacterium]